MSRGAGALQIVLGWEGIYDSQRGPCYAKKKGPFADANGPSLGRKRPRRAAVNAMSATALQQYVSAPHKKQGVLTYFPES
jgi:hypothetical protein